MLKTIDRGTKAILLVLLSLLLQLVFSRVLQWIFPLGVTVVGWHIVMMVVEGLTLLLPAFLFLQTSDTPGVMLLKEGRRALTALEAALIVVAAAAGLMLMDALATMVTLLFLQLGIPLATSDVPAATHTGLFALSLFSVAIFPGFSEELLFRGAVLGTLQRYGTRRALLLSALLFAMMHGVLQALPVHFLLGLVMGLLFLYTGSLYASILYHSLHNAFALVMDGIARTGESGGASLESLVADPQVVASLWMACVVLALFFGVIWFFSLRGVFRKARQEGYEPPVVSREAAQPLGRGVKLALLLTLLLEAALYVRSLLQAAGAA